MTRRSYAILGTGALGGYYGGVLAHAGFETHFLLRSDYTHVQEHGLRVDSVRGDFHLPRVNAYAKPSDMPACDVAVVALKTTHNDQLPQLIPPAVKNDGVVLVLENGLIPEADAAAVVGEDRVLGGLCFLCSNRLGPGHIHHMDYGHIVMGAHGRSPALSETLAEVVSDFNAAGIETAPTDDLRQARWQKLVWNIPYNGLSVVLNAQTDALMADGDTLGLVKQLMLEVVAAAEAVDGAVIEPAFVEKMLAYTLKMKPYKTSMMLDHEAGRPMEVEALFGDPLRAARDTGCDTPALAVLYRQLKFIDAQNTAG